MNTEHYKKLLLAKQGELQANLAALKGAASDSGAAEVKDYADAATAAQGASEALEESSLESQTLQEVQDALGRIEDGSYGKCTRCGRAIPPARLEAIPWTPYCLEDQEKLDGKTFQSATL